MLLLLSGQAAGQATKLILKLISTTSHTISWRIILSAEAVLSTHTVPIGTLGAPGAVPVPDALPLPVLLSCEMGVLSSIEQADLHVLWATSDI